MIEIQNILTENTSEGLESISYSFMQAGSEIWSLSFLIPLLPFIAGFIILFIGAKRQNENLNHDISIIANLGAFLIALLLFSMQFIELISTGSMNTLKFSAYFQ